MKKAMELYMKIKIGMKAIGKMVKDKAKDYMNSPMVRNILVNGLTTKDMVWEYKNL